jgi:hypothetical protein
MPSASSASTDRYGQPAPATQNGTSLFPEFASQSSQQPATAAQSGFNNPQNTLTQPAAAAGQQNRFGSNQPVFGQQNGAQQPGTQPTGNVTTLGYNNQPATTNGQQLGPDQMTLSAWLLVCLCLAGSFGANIYLGWSYADARHRYHSLVRKTTNSFHRVTAAAA